MEKLFEQAPAIIKEASKSPLGIGSLTVLCGSTVGVLMFKDSKDEHVKLYAFFALLGAFMLCLFTLARSTKKVADKVEKKAAASAPPPPPFDMSAGAPGVPYQAQPGMAMPRKQSGMAGCVVALVLFGAFGICGIFGLVGMSMMDINWEQAMKPSGTSGSFSGSSGGSLSGPLEGYVNASDGMRLLQESGQVTITLYSRNPGVNWGTDDFQPNEVVSAEQMADGNIKLTVNADVWRNARMARGLPSFGSGLD